MPENTRIRTNQELTEQLDYLKSRFEDLVARVIHNEDKLLAIAERIEDIAKRQQIAK